MRILKYYIKYLIILFSCNLFCQNQVKNDTVNEYKYGFRVGIDISKQIRTLIEDNYKGIEFVGDYRLTKNLYLASEIGNENKHIDLDALLEWIIKLLLVLDLEEVNIKRNYLAIMF